MKSIGRRHVTGINFEFAVRIAFADCDLSEGKMQVTFVPRLLHGLKCCRQRQRGYKSMRVTDPAHVAEYLLTGRQVWMWRAFHPTQSLGPNRRPGP